MIAGSVSGHMVIMTRLAVEIRMMFQGHLPQHLRNHHIRSTFVTLTNRRNPSPVAEQPFPQDFRVPETASRFVAMRPRYPAILRGGILSVAESRLQLLRFCHLPIDVIFDDATD